MRKLYKIEIKETISDIVEIEAESSSDAEYKAGEEFYDGKHILDGIYPQNKELTCKDIESPSYISEKRKEEIFDELIDYVSEHTIDEKDFYNALRNIIGLTNEEITELGIEVTRELIAIEPLRDEEIVFEDGIMVSDDRSLNAYIPLYYIDIFKKFNIKEKEDVEYNLYLNYYRDEDKSIISIIEKNEKRDIEYQYEASGPENSMLREKLNNYCIEISGQTIEECFEDEEEL